MAARFSTTDGRPVWVVIVPDTGDVDVFSTRKRAQAHAETLSPATRLVLVIRKVVRLD